MRSLRRFFNQGYCFRCGQFCYLTQHHVIGRTHGLPRLFKEEKVELCRDCHDVIHGMNKKPPKPVKTTFVPETIGDMIGMMT